MPELLTSAQREYLLDKACFPYVPTPSELLSAMSWREYTFAADLGLLLWALSYIGPVR